MHLTPETPLRFLRGVGPVRARQLATVEMETVLDLLLHVPRRYEDRRRLREVGDIRGPGLVTLRGELREVRAIRTRRRGFSLVRGVLDDATGRLPVVWFNRPYLPGWVEHGVSYLLHGEVRPLKKGGFELVNPSCEREDEALAAGRVVPVYPQAGELGPALFRRLLGRLLEDFDPAASCPDPLPPELRRRHGLPPLGEALAELHQPGEEARVDLLNRGRAPAQLRLIYGELYALQSALAQRRLAETGWPKEHGYELPGELRRRLAGLLPFSLTGAQRRVLGEIFHDLADRRPMRRLLQGDVGSGKTAVAALVLAAAAENGLQAAFMAPTELLAEQHFRSLVPVVGQGHAIALLTGSGGRVWRPEARRVEGVERDEIERGLADGALPLVVGTHALIQEAITFHRLGLAIIDEQHRFGVAQRRQLRAKGDRPDILVMTATPIPRSLALTVHGDLDISVLDELPPGREPVATELVAPAQRREVYARLRQALEKDEQAYIVFPRIGEGEGERDEEADAVPGAPALLTASEEIRSLLPGIAIGSVHGRLPAEEREGTLAAFAAGELRVLLATTVIEVGIDVPAATWMVIEGAERFGLAQLHQLRGRVGRGGRAGTCSAILGVDREALGAEAERRLQVFASTTDGFRLAEEDLAQRGPGDFIGTARETRQAGLPPFKVADLVRDWEWLLKARHDAQARVAARIAVQEAKPRAE